MGVTTSRTTLLQCVTAVPASRWTTYGDVATVIGGHAVPGGTHLATCVQCPNAWRVLNSAGRVSPGFRWTNPTRMDSPAHVLATEGIRFDGGVATQEARLTLDELRGVVGD
nr:MGMT family protein [Streptomyces globosus]